MKKFYSVLIFLILYSSLNTVALADLNQFFGKWNNIDPNSRGISSIEITAVGTGIIVQAWEKFNPNDLDWGKTSGYAYAPNGSPNLTNSARVISALFQDKAKQSLLIIRPQGTYRLQVEEFTRFLNETGRVNYHSFYSFSKNI